MRADFKVLINVLIGYIMKKCCNVVYTERYDPVERRGPGGGPGGGPGLRHRSHPRLRHLPPHPDRAPTQVCNSYGAPTQQLHNVIQHCVII